MTSFSHSVLGNIGPAGLRFKPTKKEIDQYFHNIFERKKYTEIKLLNLENDVRSRNRCNVSHCHVPNGKAFSRNHNITTPKRTKQQ